MLIFLDTEFTDLFDCELISIGMVSEDGQDLFYAERSDYRRAAVSDFVRLAVLPHLGQQAEAVCTRVELDARLWAWFATLPSHVQIACDSQQDLDLLWDAFGEGLPENLAPKRYEPAHLIDTTVLHAAVLNYEATQGCWHHALHDARANRAGWMAWVNAHKGETSS